MIRDEGLRRGRNGVTHIFTALWNYRKVPLWFFLHADLGTEELLSGRKASEAEQKAQELTRGRDEKAQLFLLFLRHLS